MNKEVDLSDGSLRTLAKPVTVPLNFIENVDFLYQLSFHAKGIIGICSSVI